MSPSLSIAANLSPVIRQRLAIVVLAKSKSVSDLATEHHISRKFVYRQVNKAEVALSEYFEPRIPDNQVVFYLPITKNWLTQANAKRTGVIGSMR